MHNASLEGAADIVVDGDGRAVVASVADGETYSVVSLISDRTLFEWTRVRLRSTRIDSWLPWLLRFAPSWAMRSKAFSASEPRNIYKQF